MSRRGTRLLATCALLLAACDRWFPEEPTTLCEDSPVWSISLKSDHLPNRDAIAEKDGVLYVAMTGTMFDLGDVTLGEDGWVHVLAALSTDDGGLAWVHQQEYPDFAFAHGVALSPDGALYSADGPDEGFTLRRIDPLDGAEVWSQLTSGERVHAIAADEGIVVTASWNDRIAAYDAISGEELWANTSPQETHLAQSIAFTGDGDVAVAQWWADNVVRPSLWVFSRTTGEPVWSYGEVPYGVEVTAADDGDVVVAIHHTPDISQDETSTASEITRLGPDGSVRWTRSLGPTSLPLDLKASGNDIIVVGSGRMFDGFELEEDCRYVAHLAAEDGTDRSLLAYCYCTGPADIGAAATADDAGRVYVKTSDLDLGTVSAFDPH